MNESKLIEKIADGFKAVFQANGPKSDTASRRVFVSLTYLFIFSIGVFVGKRFSDNEAINASLLMHGTEKSIASSPLDEPRFKQNPEAAAAPAPVVQAPVVQAPVVRPPVVRATAVPKPVAQAPVVEAPVAQAPVVEVPARPIEKEYVTIQLPRVEVVNQNQKPSPESDQLRRKFSRQVASVGATPTVGQYGVQLMVVSSVESANRAVETLAKQNIQTDFVQFKSRDGKRDLFLVYSGTFSTMDEAQSYQATLSQTYKEPTLIHKFK